MAEFDNNIEEQETVLEETKQETPVQNTEMNPVERTDNVMGWVGKFIKWISKYGGKKILEAMLCVAFVVLLGLFAIKPEKMFESYENYREKTHMERMDKRTNNTPLIQAELDKLRIQYNASWVSVWEFHNSTNNLDGMPFIFASLTYESMNPALTPIAEQFDNVRLSLYPVSSYLRQSDMWYGSVEELQKVDNTAYYRAKALGITYLGFKMMEVENCPNAALSFAFVEGAELPNMDDFIQKWTIASYKINGLLSIEKK